MPSSVDAQSMLYPLGETPLVDGYCGDWPQQAFKTSEHRYALGIVEEKMFVCAEVAHASARSSGIELKVQVGGNEQRLLLGVNERATLNGRRATVELVKGPHGSQGSGGYALEAAIPLRALRLSRTAILEGEAQLGLGSGPLEPLKIYGVRTGLDAFVEHMQLSDGTLRMAGRAQLYGGQTQERYGLVGQNVVITGPDIHGGEGFIYVDVGHPASWIESIDTKDIDRDGKQEILEHYRFQSEVGRHSIVNVYKIEAEQIRKVGGLELARQTVAGTKTCTLAFNKSGNQRRMHLWVRACTGGLSEAPELEGVTSIFSDRIVERGYTLSAQGLVQTVETVAPETSAPLTQRQTSQPTATPTFATPTSATPTSEPSIVAYDERALMNLYRQERGLRARVRERMKLRGNVARGPEEEMVLWIKDEMLVYGPGFEQGRRYFRFTAPCTDEEVLDLKLWDITRDGRKEVVLQFEKPVAREGGVARRYVFVYQFTARGFERIFAMEVGRGRLQNRVEFVTNAIRIHPGRGTRDDYPYSPNPHASRSGTEIREPLLPWVDQTLEVKF